MHRIIDKVKDKLLTWAHPFLHSELQADCNSSLCSSPCRSHNPEGNGPCHIERAPGCRDRALSQRQSFSDICHS